METYESIRDKLKYEAAKRLPEYTKHLKWDRQTIENEQLKQLKPLLKHASTHSKWYKKHLQGIDIEKFSLKDLSKIKPITKRDVMENWNDFSCVNVLDLNKLNQFADDVIHGKWNNPFYLDQYYIGMTGGSSGKRGLFVLNLDTVTFSIVIAFRSMFKDDEKLKLSKKKVAILVSSCLIHASRPFFESFPDKDAEVIALPADMALNKVVHELNKFQPTHMIGYSSMMDLLTLEAKQGNLHIHPKRISTNSEQLNEETRLRVREVWGIGINNLWGSVESGVMGYEDDHFSGMILAEDLVIIEVVDENLKPVPLGQVGEKLVITNLYNYTFPMIRYVIEDRISLKHADNGSGYYAVKAIEGRSSDWFFYEGGIKLHPISFKPSLYAVKEIDTFQIYQEKEGIEADIIAHGEFDQNKLQGDLEKVLKKAGLENPHVTIKRISELKRHAETGKFKHFIPLKKS